MKQISIYSIVFILLLSCYKQPNIYNDGTAWKMPSKNKVSDFYYDIENIYQYEGRHQEYKLKIKNFFWQDTGNENRFIESAFFIVKRWSPSGRFDYAFEYRRYVTLTDEPHELYEIREITNEYETSIQRGTTLHLENEYKHVFGGGMSPERWLCVDGFYENHNFSMYFEKEYRPLLDKIIVSELFGLNFPSDNWENYFQLDDRELELIRTKGTFIELENNSFFLTYEELENLKNELPKLMSQGKKSPHDYIEYARKELLK